MVFAIASIALRIVLRSAFEPEDRPRADVIAADNGEFVRTLPVGTCLIEAYPAGYVHPVPCAERHGSEVVALFAYPGPPGGAYPPVQEAFRQALDLCETAFEAYVGGTADQTPARFFVVLPTSAEWRGGERIVVCFASGRNGVELTSSVRGAAAAPARR
ncbi:MAG TPA: septum formation family protein [Acidimicrobiales bacterium]|nr:septum formation family protein [Acidimicrobiales bacterium]